jgi:hypothetical protein
MRAQQLCHREHSCRNKVPLGSSCPFCSARFRDVLVQFHVVSTRICAETAFVRKRHLCGNGICAVTAFVRKRYGVHTSPCSTAMTKKPLGAETQGRLQPHCFNAMVQTSFGVPSSYRFIIIDAMVFQRHDVITSWSSDVTVFYHPGAPM